MFNRITLISSFIIILFIHFTLFSNYLYKEHKRVVAQSVTIKKISLKKVTLKQKAIKKQEKMIKKQVKKKVPKPKEIVKKAKRKVLKKVVKKEAKKIIKKEQKIVKKQQEKMAPAVTKKVLDKKPMKVVSSVTKDMIKDRYLLELRKKIEANKIYPKRAKRLKQQGQVIVSFEILQDGKIVKSNMKNASKFKRLNHAAIELIEKIVRFEPIPKELDKKNWKIEIPINYYIG